MIIENKASLAVPSLTLKNQARRQPADAAAHDDAIVALAGVNRARRKILEHAIANLVPGLKNCSRVAVGVRVITHAAIAGPVITCGTRHRLPSQQLLGQGRGEQYDTGAGQRPIQKVSTRDLAIHATHYKHRTLTMDGGKDEATGGWRPAPYGFARCATIYCFLFA